MKRIEALDYLRGIMATCIMCYHYFSSSGLEFTSADFFGKIGVYGVSIFYVPSGITLFVVYNLKIETTFKSVFSFFIKRIFRIFPLLWLVTICTLIVNETDVDMYKLAINLTGLFGFINPQAAIGTGVWSIGNELVFYFFFPFLLFSLYRNKYFFYAFLLILFSISLYFSFFVLSAKSNLYPQWKTYINPMNQIILFAGGIFIAHLFKPNSLYAKKNLVRIILISMIALFLYLPVLGDTINIVTGINRVIFCCIAFIICACISTDDYKLSKPLHVILSFIGKTSYSIYLLHPLVFTECRNHLELSKTNIILVSIMITFVCSYFVYTFVESPLIRAGKKMTALYF